jgi:hypothetical protein
MTVGPYAGRKVCEVKNIIRDEMVAAGTAMPYSEPEKQVSTWLMVGIPFLGRGIVALVPRTSSSFIVSSSLPGQPVGHIRTQHCFESTNRKSRTHVMKMMGVRVCGRKGA